MSLQIANRAVISKVEQLALVTGLSKTAAVEQAVDGLLRQLGKQSSSERLAALLKQIDRIPDRPDQVDVLLWDDIGLPK